MNTHRVFVEKRNGFNLEAQRLRNDISDFFGAEHSCLAAIKDLRILFRYDAEGLSQEQFEKAVKYVFSEPQCDQVFFCNDILKTQNTDNAVPDKNTMAFGVEYLPGQYDQKADSAEQCTELAVGIKPVVRCAKYFVLSSSAEITQAAVKALQSYLINPVDSRLVIDERLRGDPGEQHISQTPADIPVLTGFLQMDGAQLSSLAKDLSLAMTTADLEHCRNYFAKENRDPYLTELRILDTYWSDHCRHTTFTTILESITLAGKNTEPVKKALALYEEARALVYGDATRSRSLMDMATIGAKLLKKRGLLSDLDESPEINACTIKVTAKFRRGEQIMEEPYLLLFKNETHNHPTEIEPFGGAATCLGGAIRDPLSGRSYVYQAMRITGAGDPRQRLSETLPGKLPQIKIAREAAAGYSSYGNQIGLATGQVAEFYHNGYTAKRMELGAVIGAGPQSQIHRSPPLAGDLVMLAGGKTGRDGIGGATGSSKIHSGESVETAGAEVQKGNAVEERKLQRLFRNGELTKLIKRCNDFGAGGVSVAVGELAPGLDINLDAVPKKYSGLNGTELAISESQERMAVVVSPENAGMFIEKAAAENLDAVVIAMVTASETGCDIKNARLTMKWQGKTIASLSRDFLDSHDGSKAADGSEAAAAVPRSAHVLINTDTYQPKGVSFNSETAETPQDQLDKIKTELGTLRSCSKRGLQERFDSTIGASTVLFPWGGEYQATPECGMAALLPLPLTPAEFADTGTDSTLPPQSLTASLMSFGFDPAMMEANPYEGAKAAVKEALAKYACMGGDYRKARLSMQEYFEKMEKSESWGKAAATLLGALEAQLALEVPAIGGKDSMSGSYRDPANNIDLTVPPTLVVFAAGTADAALVRSGTLSGKKGNPIILLYDDGENDEWETFKINMGALAKLSVNGLVKSAYPVGAGGAGAALALMAFGNMTGIEVDSLSLKLIDEKTYPGAVLVELDGEAINKSGGEEKLGEALQTPVWKGAGRTITEPVFRINSSPHRQRASSAAMPLTELLKAFETPLLHVYPQVTNAGGTGKIVLQEKQKEKKRPLLSTSHTAHPLVVLPVFPGTNCEWDMERAFKIAGARTRLIVFRNRSAEDVAASIKELALAIGDAQIVALSGGFSAGDEPDGSGKFIANVFRSPAIAAAVVELLKKRDGLMLGVCNGFQALIKLGLVPYGTYREAAAASPTLSFNSIGRHVSRMVRTVVMPSASPWLSLEETGTVHVLPVSHGEGRMIISRGEAEALFKSKQIPFCYSDKNGEISINEPENPNGSAFAIESLTSPDGRVLGKMAHSERCGQYVHINIPGNKYMKIFEAGVRYFS